MKYPAAFLFGILALAFWPRVAFGVDDAVAEAAASEVARRTGRLQGGEAEDNAMVAAADFAAAAAAVGVVDTVRHGEISQSSVPGTAETLRECRERDSQRPRSCRWTAAAAAAVPWRSARAAGAGGMAAHQSGDRPLAAGGAAAAAGVAGGAAAAAAGGGAAARAAAAHTAAARTRAPRTAVGSTLIPTHTKSSREPSKT